MALTFFDGSYADAPVEHLRVGEQEIAYRAVGHGGTPLVLLVHLSGTLDNWDPELVDALSRDRAVVAIDYEDAGASSGKSGLSVHALAEGAARFIRTSSLGKVDALGLSLGGFVLQDLLIHHPDLFRKAILAGTGPAGGLEIEKVPGRTFMAMAKAALKRKDPKHYLFYPPSAWDKADRILARMANFTHPDAPMSVPTFLRQLVAVYRWGKAAPQDLSRIPHEVLVVNGDADLMVPSPNTLDMAYRIPRSSFSELYPQAGHGAIFQEGQRFAQEVHDFLEESPAAS